MVKFNSLAMFIGFIALLLCGCVTKHSEGGSLNQTELNWKLVWSDEFEGDHIDHNKWNFVKGAGGYGNNELQYYSDRDKNARIENGKLIIEAHKEDFVGSPYTSAKMTTNGKGDWTYGRFEIRAKLPEGQGIWPAFWMMPSDYDIYGKWPSCGEIDIMELLGHEPNITHGTLHYGLPHKYTGDNFKLKEGSFSESFHTFSIEWLPGEIRWYVDDILFQVQNDWYSSPDLLSGDLAFPAPFDRDFYMQFNLAVGGDWPGYPDKTTKFPQQIVVDWIRVYELEEGYKGFKIKNTSDEESTIIGRSPDVNGSYVINGDFKNGFDNWIFENYEGGSGSSEIIDETAHILINSGGTQKWGNQLYQTDMNIQKNGIYNISFKAKAEEDRNIMIKIGGLADRGWAAYSSEIIVPLTKEMREYNFQFTMKENTDIHARFEFNMGLSDKDIWIDDISLIQINEGEQDGLPILDIERKPLDDGNLIYNGTFDRGPQRTNFWELEVDSDSDALLNVTPEIYKREGNIVTIDSSGKEDGIVLYQNNIDLESGESYELSFDAYSRSERQIAVSIQDKNGINIYTPEIINLKENKMGYSVIFPVLDALENVRIAFIASIGDSTSKITLDNISFIKVKKPITVGSLTRIEAEDFSKKSSGPQTQAASEGTLNIGWMGTNDWLRYNLLVEKEGTYKIRYRVASEYSSIVFKAVSNNTSDYQDVSGSGNWQSWKTVEGVIELTKGETYIEIIGEDFNLNWIELELIK